MKQTVNDLRNKYEELNRPYDRRIGVYPCRSINFGPQTATFPHYDVANLSHSWCSITALGTFDAKKGGQLALWELGLYVDFPAGTTALIPSSVLCHSNTPIQAHEERYSIVQYAAGGLFRWVENGFMSDAAWLEKATEDDRTAKELQP